ncbi:class I SAM-dependent methyltransferase [Asaia bogorensis]|uniref:class I SAM-dependent methyltransferase n=1 Tax=Asaia bogorensis TaxID=91915 RepID=UPI000EFCD8B4|nr:class I SAM-dependent methyltransferase [Asaia bogorensis]
MSEFVTGHYGPRASDYVSSKTHAVGEDLERLVALLREETPGVALDLGCGGGHVSYAMAPFCGQVVAYDPTLSMANAVRNEAERRGLTRIRPVGGFAESLPFAEGIFDVVASRFSAHHWFDLQAGLNEARRVLRRGGLGIFIDTVAPEAPMADSVLQAIETLRDPSHMRNYRVSEWRRSLESAGFALEDYQPLRLKLDFTSWVARTRTPALHQQAILSLQRATDAGTRQHFAVEADGSFTLDTALFTVR